MWVCRDVLMSGESGVCKRAVGEGAVGGGVCERAVGEGVAASVHFMLRPFVYH